MAFSKSRISRDKQGESLVDMTVEPSASLGSVLKTGPPDHTQDNVMDGRQDSPCGCFRHAGGIFPEGHISTIKQAGLDQPMFPSDLHYPLG